MEIQAWERGSVEIFYRAPQMTGQKRRRGQKWLQVLSPCDWKNGGVAQSGLQETELGVRGRICGKGRKGFHVETFHFQVQVDLTLPGIPLRVSLACSLSHTSHIVPLLAVSPSGPLLFCLPPDSHLDTIFHLSSIYAPDD